MSEPDKHEPDPAIPPLDSPVWDVPPASRWATAGARRALQVVTLWDYF